MDKDRSTKTNTKRQAGRKGDPRMNIAVQAKLDNPSISLITALSMGGFKFCVKDGGLESQSMDCEDNVSLIQRKNQLNRRIRQIKEKQKSDNVKKTNTNQVVEKKRSSPNENGNNYNDSKKKIRTKQIKDIQNDDHHHVNETNKELNNDKKELSSDTEKKINIALSHYCTEAASLLKNCMAKAGFSPEQMFECDEAYLLFLERALDSERVRLTRLRNMVDRKPLNGTTNNENLSTDLHPKDRSTEMRSRQSSAYASLGNHSLQDISSEDSCSNSANGHSSFTPTPAHIQAAQAHNHSHSHNHHINSNCQTDVPIFIPQRPSGSMASMSIDDSMPCFATKHKHQLEGKCGHQAIIHKPKNGPKHVDFIVNGKIECYAGLSPYMDNGFYWPSRFTCEQMPDHDCSGKQKQNQSDHKCDQKCSGYNSPKIYEITDIDLDAGEWFHEENDVEMSEESLLDGLLKLYNE